MRFDQSRRRSPRTRGRMQRPRFRGGYGHSSRLASAAPVRFLEENDPCARGCGRSVRESKGQKSRGSVAVSVLMQEASPRRKRPRHDRQQNHGTRANRRPVSVASIHRSPDGSGATHPRPSRLRVPSIRRPVRRDHGHGSRAAPFDRYRCDRTPGVRVPRSGTRPVATLGELVPAAERFMVGSPCAGAAASRAGQSAAGSYEVGRCLGRMGARLVARRLAVAFVRLGWRRCSGTQSPRDDSRGCRPVTVGPAARVCCASARRGRRRRPWRCLAAGRCVGLGVGTPCRRANDGVGR